QAVLEDLLVALLLLLLALGIVDSALAADEGRRRRHHRDQVKLGLAPGGHVAGIEQGLLAGLGAVVGEEYSLVHGRAALRIRRSPPRNNLYPMTTKSGSCALIPVAGHYMGKSSRGTRPRPGRQSSGIQRRTCKCLGNPWSSPRWLPPRHWRRSQPVPTRQTPCWAPFSAAASARRSAIR